MSCRKVVPVLAKPIIAKSSGGGSLPLLGAFAKFFVETVDVVDVAK